MGSMADTPFEYTSSDDDGPFSDPSNLEVDRTKKLSVRISNVVDVNIYRNDTPDSEDNDSAGGCDDDDEDSVSIDGDRGDGRHDHSDSHYDHPPSSSLQERLSESDSVFSEESVPQEKTIGGKTIQERR